MKAGGFVQVLVEDVKELNFEFYDAKEDRWEDEWDTTHRDYARRLPLFVKIELIVPGAGDEDEKFVTKTRVFLKESLLIAGTGFSQCIE